MRTINDDIRKKPSIARLLRQARRSRKMTQRGLAEHLKVGQQAVSNWERGASRPSDTATLNALAALFPEYDVGEWRSAAGQARPPDYTTNRPARSRANRPLLETLPLHKLSFREFQGFSSLLLELLYEGEATVNQFGVEGDPQDGIDIEIRFTDGRYWIAQCKKRERFGPSDAAQAFENLRTRSDRALLMLSRRATSGTRKVFSRNRRWDLWDMEDISRRVRKLSLINQKHLVGAYFPGCRRDFLGLDDPGALVRAQEFFGPRLRLDSPFSHAWTMVGRDESLATLTTLVARESGEATILVGTGGIGKSRLVKAVCDAIAENAPRPPVLILDGGTAPTPGDLELLEEDNTLVVVEDAHKHGNLGTVLSALVAKRARLLVTTRPYALPLVQSEIRRAGLNTDEAGLVCLEPLGRDDAESVAREILSRTGGPVDVAPDVARLTRGLTVALVVGSYLVATKQLHPSVLNSADTFRDELLRRLQSVLTREVGPGAESERARTVLDLVSLTQPIDPDAPSFMELAQAVLGLRPDQIRFTLDGLEKTGALSRGGRLLRIVPDLFGEFILENACLRKRRSTGYFEHVMSLAGAHEFATILQNVSRLDWRLSATESEPFRIANAAWGEVEHTWAHDDSRRPWLADAVAQAAYYVPAHALAFYDQHGQDTAYEAAWVTLLKHAAMTLDFLRPSLDGLWAIATAGSRRATNDPDHPLGVLKNIAQIAPRKPLPFSEATVEMATRVIKERKCGENVLPAFEILGAALATEGHTFEARGQSLVLSPFGVLPDAVATLRQRIVDFLIGCLGDGEFEIAITSARTLADALRYPMGILGRPTSDEEQNAWGRQFVDTLAKLRDVVAGSDLEPLVLVEIQNAIHWHAQYSDGPTRGPACAVLEVLPRTLEYQVSRALADGWGHLAEGRAEDPVEALTAWRKEQIRVAKEMLSQNPDQASVVDILRNRLRLLRRSGVASHGEGIFISILTEQDPRVAAAICEEVLSDADSALNAVFPEALARMLATDPGRALQIAGAGLAQGDTALIRGVATAYAGRLSAKTTLVDGERELAQRLLESEDPGTVSLIMPGIAGQAGLDPAWAIATLLKAHLEDPKIADEVCSVFSGRRTDVSVATLSPGALHDVLGRLRACPSIDGHWIKKFLADASRTRPAAVLQFLISRIEWDTKEESWSYDPLPHDWGNRGGLSFREAPDFPLYLSMIRSWMSASTENSRRFYWGRQLYRLVAGSFDAAALSDLQGWAGSREPEKVSVVAALLAEAPNSFVFDNLDFVVAYLDNASSLGSEALQEAKSALWASACSGIRQRAPGGASPADERRRDRAADALSRVSRGSPAWEFFNELKKDAEADIRGSAREDAEIFDDA